MRSPSPTAAAGAVRCRTWRPTLDRHAGAASRQRHDRRPQGPRRPPDLRRSRGRPPLRVGPGRAEGGGRGRSRRPLRQDAGARARLGAAWLALGDACRRSDRSRRRGGVAAQPCARPGRPDGRRGPPRRGRAAARGAGLQPAYVARLFDDYAPRFESHLTEALGYRGRPSSATLSPRRHPAGGSGGRSTSAAARDSPESCSAPLADRLAGCDLSPAMLDRARRRGLYDELACRTSSRRSRPSLQDRSISSFAADVLIYVADLAPSLPRRPGLSRPAGCFAFTTQASGRRTRVVVGADLRVRHATPTCCASPRPSASPWPSSRRSGRGASVASPCPGWSPCSARHDLASSGR